MTWTDEDRRREVVDAPLGAHLGAPDTRIIDAGGWYRTITPSVVGTALNEVVRARIAPAEVERTVDRVLDEYRALGGRWKWVVAFDSSPMAPLIDALTARAGQAWEATAMTAPTDLAVEAPDIAVERGALAEYDALNGEAWGLAVGVERLRAAKREQSYRFYVVKDGGEPVAMAGYQAKARSAYLTSAYVRPSHRGRGLYRRLIATRLRAARAEGLRLATTQARSSTSGPILTTLGFRDEYRFRVFTGR